MAGAVAVAAQKQMSDDVMAKIEEVKGNLKKENLFLHGKLAAERAVHSLVLIDNICLKRDRKNAVEKKRSGCAALAAERTK